MFPKEEGVKRGTQNKACKKRLPHTFATTKRPLGSKPSFVGGRKNQEAQEPTTTRTRSKTQLTYLPLAEAHEELRCVSYSQIKRRL